MAVTCVQNSDGVIQVEILIPPQFPGQTDQQLLDWKGDMHAAAGWTVAWAGNRRSFNASKNYPPEVRLNDPNAILSKTRLFRRAGQ